MKLFMLDNSLESSRPPPLESMLRRYITSTVQDSCGHKVISRTGISCVSLQTQLGYQKKQASTVTSKSSNASHTASIAAKNEREQKIIGLVEQRMQLRERLLEEVCCLNPRLSHRNTYPLLV